MTILIMGTHYKQYHILYKAQNITEVLRIIYNMNNSEFCFGIGFEFQQMGSISQGSTLIDSESFFLKTISRNQ